MEAATTEDRPAPVRLADEPDFQLGGAEVRPSALQVRIGTVIERLEPRVMQVLVALAAAAGATVSREALIARCWGGMVVGDDAVNRVIGRLRRLSEHEGSGFSIETVPRIGYRLSREPLAAAVEAVPPPAAAQIAVSRRWAFAAGGVAVLGVVGGGAFLARPRSAASRPRLVAVLPFDGDAGPEGVRLADGVSDAVLSGLTRNGGMPVAARHSSFQFRGERKPRAAAELGASHLVDGSVSRSGGALRVTAFLVDTDRNVTLWSERFDAPLSDVFMVQDRIATRVAESLRVRLDARPAPRSIDPVAYDLYTRADLLLEQPADGALPQAIAYLEEVVARAPAFALGWATLAEAQRRRITRSPPLEHPALIAISRQSAERALRLDPGLGQVYGTLADLVPRFGRWAEVDQLFQRGLATTPEHPRLLEQHAYFHLTTGRFAEGGRRILALQARDPLNADLAANVAGVLFDSGNREAALAMIDRAHARWPEQGIWSARVAMHAHARSFDTALSLLDAPPPGISESLLRMRRRAYLAQRDRRPEDVEATIRDFEALSRTGVEPAMVAMLALSLVGASERALALADSLYRTDAPQAFGTGVSMNRQYILAGQARTGPLFVPVTAGMRRLPGFLIILRRIGLTDYWRQARITPDLCGERGLGFSCRAELARG